LYLRNVVIYTFETVARRAISFWIRLLCHISLIPSMTEHRRPYRLWSAVTCAFPLGFVSSILALSHRVSEDFLPMKIFLPF
jgi:hypothetical protein